MPISITISPSSNEPKLPEGLAKISHDEIVLIELQGTLEVECNDPKERNGRLVGKLKIDDTTGKPSLIIGNHLLEGKIASLPKPLAIIKRSRTDPSSHVLDKEAMDCEPLSRASSSESVNWIIVGVVKKKIIFSKRPMPIVTK